MKATHRAVLVAFAVLAVAASAAVAAASTTFSGKTGQKAQISFRATSTMVSKLTTTVTVSCLGAYPVLKHELVAVPIASKVSATLHNGSFTFTIPAPVSHKPGKNERTVVAGKIRGHSASGSIKTLFGKTWMVTDPRTGSPTIEIGSCAARTSWSAKS
jgi:hypothetical protein